MNLSTVLVIIGIVLALLSALFVNRIAYLLNIAVACIGVGVLLGVVPLMH